MWGISLISAHYAHKVKGPYFGHLRLIKGFCGLISVNCYQFWTEYTLNIDKYITPQKFQKCAIYGTDVLHPNMTVGPVIERQ